jgi:hypothetical protein
MAVTIVNEPEITFSKNTALVRLRTNRRLQTTGAKAYYHFSLGAFPTVGQTLIFSYNGKTITMTCANPIDDSGLQFVPGFISIPVYSNFLVAQLNQNYQLANDWEITWNSGAGRIEFRARNVGAAWNLTVTGTVNRTNVFSSPGVNQVLTPNLTIGLRLWFKNTLTNLFELIVEKEHYPYADSDLFSEANASVDFDIAPYLHAHLGENAPPFGSSTPFNAGNIKSSYFFEYYERYGTTPTEKLLLKSTEKTVLKGGVNTDLWHSIRNQPSTLFFNANPRNNISNRKNPRYTTPDNDEWIYFYNYNGDAPIRCYVDIIYTDGTTSNNNLIHHWPWAANYQTVAFPVGLNNTSIAAINSTKTIAEYTVRITNAAGNVVLSPLYRYVVEQAHFNDIYILYQNSFYAWETLRCYGPRETILQVEKTEFEQELKPDYTADARTLYNETQYYTKGFKLSTGNIHENEIEDVLELLIGKNILVKGENKYLPFFIPKGNYSLKKTDVTLYSIEFEMYHANRQNNR